MHPYPQARQQAQNLADIGDLAGARTELEGVVAAGLPGLAAGDPELLVTMRQLAGVHAHLGDPAAARRLLEQAYAAGHRLGPADPLLVLLASDLAAVAEELGNRLEARRNAALVVEYGPAALGADHPAVARARARLSPAAPPIAGPPVAVPPVSAPPVAVPPVSVPPISAQPMSVTPVSSAFGQPVSTPPFEPPFDQKRRSRMPWIITAAAVVFAVAMLVVVFMRPSAEAPAGNDAALSPATETPATAGGVPGASVPPSTGAAAAPSAAATNAAVPSPEASKPAATTPAAARPTTTKPRTTTAPAVTRIVSPANGASVQRNLTVKLTASPGDVYASKTRLALTVCVQQWCFFDGPVTFANGKAKSYPVPLGSKDGEGVGQKWTIRVDRLTLANYNAVVSQKQAAVAKGTWGSGDSTPMSKLNGTPVSKVVLTKAS